jgi:hypothetical protein
MVTTRRRSSDAHGSPAAAPAPSSSPATPAAPPATTPRRGADGALRSALKSAAPPSGARRAHSRDPTPAKKRVRIHTSENLVHVFEPSAALAASSDDDDDGAGAASSAWRASPRGGAAAPSPAASALGAVLALALWAAASSYLIFFTASLLRPGGAFPFPALLAAASQLGCGGLAAAAGAVGLARVRPAPCGRGATARRAAMAAAAAAGLALGNAGSAVHSVAFLNMLKAAVPAVTLAVAGAAGVERLSPGALAATAVIGAGAYRAAAEEVARGGGGASGGGFHWLGFAAFAASVLFEALRVVFAAALMRGGDSGSGSNSASNSAGGANPVEVLAHVAPLAGLFALLLAAPRELPALHLALSSGALDGGVAAGALARVVAAALAVNLSSYAAIRATSSTTFKVAGCLKNVGVVAAGLARGDAATPRQLQGFALSCAGFLLYTAARAGGGGGGAGAGRPPARRRAPPRRARKRA